jgi:hypothetical protein
LPQIEIAMGEFFDRLTILEIKHIYLASQEQKDHVFKEIVKMKSNLEHTALPKEIIDLVLKLKQINLDIWHEMNSLYQIREPNKEYAELSFRITWLNQQRAFTKRKIDLEFGSALSEEKSYFLRSSEIIPDS